MFYIFFLCFIQAHAFFEQYSRPNPNSNDSIYIEEESSFAEEAGEPPFTEEEVTSTITTASDDDPLAFARPDTIDDDDTPETALATYDDPDLDLDITALGNRVKTYTLPKDDERIFTLQEAIDAVMTDVRMAALVSEVGGAIVSAQAYDAEFLPELSAKAGSNHTRTDPRNLSDPMADINSSHRRRTSYGLEARYAVFKGFADVNTRKAARLSANAVKMQALYRVSEMLTEVVKVYTQAIASQNVQLAQERKLILANEALKVAQERYRLGDITESDLKSAQSSIAQARSEKEKAKNDCFKARCQLENLTGYNLDNQAFENIAVPGVLPDTLDECIESALTHSPEIKKADIETLALRKQLSAARGRFAPTVSTFAKAEHVRDTMWSGNNKPDDPTRQNREWSAGIELSVPIDYRGAIANNTRQISYKIEKEIANLRFTRRNVTSQIKILWFEFQTSSRTIAHLEAGVKASAAAWRAIREGYEQGTKIALELLQSEKDYIAAEIDLIRAKQDRIVRAFELLHHTGLLSFHFLKNRIPTQHLKGLNFIRNMGQQINDK